MKVLSLFNGISGLHLACDRAGINVATCYYSEIDKYANKVTEHHYPDDISMGDVTKWREWNIDWSSIDLVGAGFPCQAWSVAGQQLGDKDERGMLFWTTLEIIKHVLYFNPKAKFLMENVKMKKDFEEYITHHTTQALGYVEKTLINSALVSAQNRNRYYWTNFEVTQPDDKGINATTILEPGFYCDREKTYCLDANYGKGSNFRRYFFMGSRQIVFKNGFKIPNMTKETANNKMHECRGLYRFLLPIECERLQTLPENWTSMLSNTQRYKSAGNGWTIDVIAHILKHI